MEGELAWWVMRSGRGRGSAGGKERVGDGWEVRDEEEGRRAEEVKGERRGEERRGEGRGWGGEKWGLENEWWRIIGFGVDSRNLAPFIGEHDMKSVYTYGWYMDEVRRLENALGHAK